MGKGGRVEGWKGSILLFYYNGGLDIISKVAHVQLGCKIDMEEIRFL